jgi:poly-gamma-glutamate capsule biosynthesis protein CapA/YwtB (metallophosphatase superfamily)
MMTKPLCIFLCGDVMTGRGIDQVLPHPGNPAPHESYVRDSRDYVKLAENVNGPIPRPVPLDYIWGDALAELRHAETDVGIINLETSITRSDNHWPGKAIHYRMHPENIGCITAAQIHCCCLANNHVLDWGYEGLTETLQTLNATQVLHAGAGANVIEAAAPATLTAAGKGRVLVFSFGSTTSGIPPEWAATADRPGVNLLENLSEKTAARIASEMHWTAQSGDVEIASIHWGPNWGYDVSPEQVRFARRLVEEGVHIVHGHSSHHVKPAEVYKDCLILYGCGDFLTDYEGISGYERFRGDLALMYLVKIDPQRGRLLEVRLVPMQSRRFRLNRASAADARWLHDLMNRLGTPFGTQARLEDDNRIALVWR